MANPVEQILQQQPEPATTSLFTQLHTVERHWVWKAGIRVVIPVVNIVAISCAAYLVAERHPEFYNDSYYYYYEYVWLEGPATALVVLCVSTLWCLLWIAIPLLLKPRRPLHPGIAVGIDLILWLAFIAAGLFALAGAWSYSSPGTNVALSDDSSAYSGHYTQASDGTLVYEITNVRPDYSGPHYNSTTGVYDYPPTPDISTVNRACTPSFDSCQQKDDFVNSLWRERKKRRSLSIVVDAVAWLDVLLHLALFVWACVDTHRWNRRKSMTQEKLVADKIIANLESRGLISVQNGVVTYIAGVPAANTILAQPPPVAQPQQQPTTTTTTSSSSLPPMAQTPRYPTFHPIQQPTAESSSALADHGPVSPITREV